MNIGAIYFYTYICISYVTEFCMETNKCYTIGLLYFISPANTWLHSYTTHSHRHYQAWLTGPLI